MGWTRWIGVSVVSVVAACGIGDELDTGSTNQAMTTSNGAWQNGLTTNALTQNGAWQNGAWQNGVLQNGAWQNGAWQNGAWQNGAWQNGAWQNGAWQNGAWQNGAWQNGAWQNGAWQNGIDEEFWQNGTWTAELWNSTFWQQQPRHDLLAQNPYTAKVLQYIYSCAMPSTVHRVLDAGGGLTVQLDGGIGLEPQWDTVGGSCDESCQRWISACVLARTNAYGVQVEISLRVPDTAPDSIQKALALGPTEAQDYPHREGTYFGNIFATQPIDDTGAILPAGTGDGSLIMNTPFLFACSGPYSNIPDLTKRFVSSVGDGGPVHVLGNCEPLVAGETPVCTGLDKADIGAEKTCYGPPSFSDGSLRRYDEVITVYLKDPIAKCGNNVCEESETIDLCPSDCHPGWTKAIDADPDWGQANSLGWGSSKSAMTPDDGIVVGGISYGPIDLGAGPIAGPSSWLVAMQKFDSHGTPQWSTSYAAQILQNDMVGGGFAVSPGDGSISVAAHAAWSATDSGWVGRFVFDPDATPTTPPHMAAGFPVTFGGATQVTPNANLSVDSSGNTYVMGYFSGTATIGTSTLVSAGAWDTFVTKIGPTGTILWATRMGGTDYDSPDSMALDPSGDVVVSYGMNQPALVKLDGASGSVKWTSPGEYHGIAIDAHGTIFAGYDRFYAALRKIKGADGSVLGEVHAARICAPGATCGSGILSGVHVVIDAEGSVIMSSTGGGMPRGFDFGAGEFMEYATYDTFLAAYSATDLSFRWAKHVPMVLSGSERSLSLDSTGNLVMTGLFTGSMVFDSRVIVSSNPASQSHPNMFVGSFKRPSLTDTTPPTLFDLPDHIVLQATSASGAMAWYSLPTAIDTGYAGTNVVCDPPPNTWFPIGDTTVNCTAWDPLGNPSLVKTFVVTVKDIIAPTFISMPVIQSAYAATSTSGAIVDYNLPIAFDQIDSAFETVTCDHLSGSLFAIGTTNVTCTATDKAGNTIVATIPITVTSTDTTPPAATASTDTTPPNILVPAAFTVEATSADGAIATYSTTTTDNVDGPMIATCAPASGSTFPIGADIVTCTATDRAGNEASAGFAIYVVDTTPPSITANAPSFVEATSPSGAPVTYTVSATDAVGVASTTCDLPSGSVFPLGPTTVHCTATDLYGLSATTSFTVTVGDTTPPVFGPLPNLSATATSADGASVSFSPTGSDLVSGTLAATCTPASGSMFALGTTTVSCSVTDGAGNTARATFTVSVTAPWSGFQQPINSDGSSIFKVGLTIPVKFQAGGITGLTATIRFSKVSNTVTGTELEGVAVVSSADSGTTFRYDPLTGNYVFNLSTTGLSAGTYQIGANLGDGVWHTVNVSLKK